MFHRAIHQPMASKASNLISEVVILTSSLYHLTGMSSLRAGTTSLLGAMSVERGLNSISPYFPEEAGRTQGFRQQADTFGLCLSLLRSPLYIVIINPMSNPIKH